MGLHARRIHAIARDTVSLLLRDGDIRITPGRSGELLRRELAALLHACLATTRATREELEQSSNRDRTRWSVRWRAFLAAWRGNADVQEAVEKVVDWIFATPTIDQVLISRYVLRKKVASVFADDPAIEVQAEGKALQRTERSVVSREELAAKTSDRVEEVKGQDRPVEIDWEAYLEDAQYITPDVFVHKMGDGYTVVLNDDGLSKLRISGAYRQALRKGAMAPGKTKEFIQDKLRSAQWLIRSIHQRQRTIYKVTESIVKFQRDFLDKGVTHLRPLILRDVAEDIQMHESTVSRVTTSKYVHTPQGIYELKYFFNSSIARVAGEDTSSEAVKNQIKQVVAQEDAANPYSDQKIVELLRAQGVEIARRTVAKYREVLGILPSSKRKKYY